VNRDKLHATDEAELSAVRRPKEAKKRLSETNCPCLAARHRAGPANCILSLDNINLGRPFFLSDFYLFLPECRNTGPVCCNGLSDGRQVCT
jgi:hypothetical protein